MYRLSQTSDQPMRSNETWLPHLLFYWSVFSLITFLVMLTHQSDAPEILGRYSKLVFSQILALLVVTGILAILSIWLSGRPQLLNRINQQLNRFRANPILNILTVVLAAGSIFVVWILVLGNHLPTYAFLRLFLTSSIVVGALALLYGGAETKFVSWIILPVVIIAVLGCIFIVTLPYFPALAKTDESFVFSMARNALEAGQLRPTIYRQAFPEYYYGGIWTWMMAVWLKFAGISLTSGRLYVFILGLIAVGFLYLGTRRLYDKMTAWFVVLIGIYTFASLNHIRFDIHTAFWLSIGIFFYSLTDIPQAWWTHLATGFTIGMCVDSNPVGYCFGLGLALVYLWDYLRSIRSKQWIYRPFWLMAVGGGLALLLFLKIHSGDSFAAGQTTGGMVSAYGDTIKNNIIYGLYAGQLQKYFFAFLTAQPILFGLMTMGIITAVIERRKADRFLLILYFTWMAIIVFAYFYFPLFYLTLAAPLFVMLAARGVTRGLSLLINTTGTVSNTFTRTTALLLSVWLLAAIAYGVMKLPADSMEDVIETGRQISAIMPQDATIVAAEPYYFGMLNHPNFVGGGIESLMSSTKNLSPESVWTQIKPDALVFSQNWPTEPRRTPALLSYMQSEQFGLLACYKTKNFGRVELWARNSPNKNDLNLVCTNVCNPRTGC